MRHHSLCVHIVAAVKGHYRPYVYIVLHLCRAARARIQSTGGHTCCSGPRSSLSVALSPSLTLGLLQAEQLSLQGAVVWQVPVITAEVRDLGCTRDCAQL